MERILKNEDWWVTKPPSLNVTSDLYAINRVIQLPYHDMCVKLGFPNIENRPYGWGLLIMHNMEMTVQRPLFIVPTIKTTMCWLNKNWCIGCSYPVPDEISITLWKYLNGAEE